MIDHNKIENAINSYFKDTPSAKIVENLDRHSAVRDKDLERENIKPKATNKKDSIISNVVRFEEVSQANQDAAFLAVSIESLVASLGLPLYKGYDDLDEIWLTFLTLPSGEAVTLMEYVHSSQPGVCISVDIAMQNIPQIVFESCQQLQVSREEVIWFYPDWQDEIDRLFAEHGSILKSQRDVRPIVVTPYVSVSSFVKSIVDITLFLIGLIIIIIISPVLVIIVKQDNQRDSRGPLSYSFDY